MDAGILDQRVRILSRSSVEGDFGSNEAFAEAGWRWASKVDVSDGERGAGGGLAASRVSRFVVRQDSLTRTINATFRLEHKGLAYDVRGVKDAQGYGGFKRGEAFEITGETRADAA